MLWDGSAAMPIARGRRSALAGAEFLDAESQEVGEPLSPWRPGTMEFHHIYTGHGESVFHIFPDGTSLLIDAGQLERGGYELKSVTLPDALCRIGDRSFDSCRALGELKLPAALSEIGRSAFSGCKGITLYYKGDEEKWRELSASVVLPKNTSVTFETAE